MKIGVIIDSFRMDFEAAAIEAKKLGADGVQIGAKWFIDDPSPEEKSKELAKILKNVGLEASAICGDIGCDMFYTENRELIEKSKKIMECASIFGTNIVTTHIGVVPEDKECPQYKSMHKVCSELADFAKSKNAHFAVETGPEMSDILCDFLDSLGNDGVSVNLDPANLVMCAGDDPVNAVKNLGKYIVHTHAKDGVMLVKTDTKRIYASKYFGLERPTERCFLEVPLGEGKVGFETYLKALSDIGYDGYLTIEREVGDTPAQDIGKAVVFLDSFKVR